MCWRTCRGKSLLILVFALCLQMACLMWPTRRRTDQDAHKGGDSTSVVHEIPPFFGTGDLTVACCVQFVNTAQKTVHIKSVGSSCGCAKARLAKVTLKPNEATELHVNVNMDRNGGRRSVTCLIEGDTGDRWVHVLNAVAYPFVRPANRLAHLAFGAVDPGNRVVRDFVLEFCVPTSVADLPQLVSTKAESTSLEVASEEVRGPFPLENGGGRKFTLPLRVALSPGTESGPGTSVLTFSCRAGEIAADYRLAVTWLVRSAFEVSSSRVHLGALMPSSKPLFATVRVRRIDGQSLEIRDVSLTPGPVHFVRSNATTSDEQVLTFGIRPADAPDVFAASAFVHTNHPAQSTVRISFSGRVVSVGDQRTDSPAEDGTTSSTQLPNVSGPYSEEHEGGGLSQPN